MLEPSDKVKERINSLSLPENYTALQVRNAPDWDDYGRNENLQLFLDEIKTFPKDTIFYLSAMNKDISDFIKNNSDYIFSADRKNAVSDPISVLLKKHLNCPYSVCCCPLHQW